MEIPQEEEWRPVIGWPYEASSLGRVRRSRDGHCTKVGKILIQSPGKKGYLRVTLSDGLKRRWSTPVHILICLTFHGPKPVGLYDAAHWNGDHLDNKASNLRWATRRENILDKERHGRLALGVRNGNGKITDDEVRAIRRLAKSQVARITAAQFGIHVGTVHAIVQRRWRWHVSEEA